MSTYQVVEKFVSINGEGRRAGELATFIRFKGCNLQCSYCDTSWANEPGCESERLTEEEILSWIRETGACYFHASCKNCIMDLKSIKTFSAETVPVCKNMKKVFLEKVLHVLKTGENEVHVTDETRENAKRPLERMLELAK